MSVGGGVGSSQGHGSTSSFGPRPKRISPVEPCFRAQAEKTRILDMNIKCREEVKCVRPFHCCSPSFLQVLLEDEHLAIVLKPYGVKIHGGDSRRTVTGALAAGALNPSSLPDALNRPQPVHRLDAAVGGLLVVAKTRSALVTLSDDFAARRVSKVYRALLCGRLEGRDLLGDGVLGGAEGGTWNSVGSSGEDEDGEGEVSSSTLSESESGLSSLSEAELSEAERGVSSSSVAELSVRVSNGAGTRDQSLVTGMGSVGGSGTITSTSSSEKSSSSSSEKTSSNESSSSSSGSSNGACKNSSSVQGNTSRGTTTTTTSSSSNGPGSVSSSMGGSSNVNPTTTSSGSSSSSSGGGNDDSSSVLMAISSSGNPTSSSSGSSHLGSDTSYKVTLPLDGKQCCTTYKVLSYSRCPRYGGWITSVELSPVTGRKHQLRRHMAALGHPIVGDGL